MIPFVVITVISSASFPSVGRVVGKSSSSYYYWEFPTLFWLKLWSFLFFFFCFAFLLFFFSFSIIDQSLFWFVFDRVLPGLILIHPPVWLAPEGLPVTWTLFSDKVELHRSSLHRLITSPILHPVVPQPISGDVETYTKQSRKVPTGSNQRVNNDPTRWTHRSRREGSQKTSQKKTDR